MTISKETVMEGRKGRDRSHSLLKVKFKSALSLFLSVDLVRFRSSSQNLLFAAVLQILFDLESRRQRVSSKFKRRKLCGSSSSADSNSVSVAGEGTVYLTAASMLWLHGKSKRVEAKLLGNFQNKLQEKSLKELFWQRSLGYLRHRQPKNLNFNGRNIKKTSFGYTPLAIVSWNRLKESSLWILSWLLKFLMNASALTFISSLSSSLVWFEKKITNVRHCCCL